MQHGKTTHPSVRSALAVVVVVALVLLAAAPGGAQTDEPAGGPLEIGPWVGSGSALGVFAGEYDQAEIVWDGGLFIDVQFELRSGGVITAGTWTMDGYADTTASGVIDGNPIELSSIVDYDGGGAIAGSPTTLLLTGATTITGTSIVYGDGRELSVDIDETTGVDGLEVDIEAVTCNVAEGYADWALATQRGLESTNIVSALEINGGMMLVRDVEVLSDDIEALLEDWSSETALDTASAQLGSSSYWVLTKVLQNEYAELANSYPEWDWDEVIDVLERAEELLNLFRNLTPCDVALFGEDNVRHFMNGLTFMVQDLLRRPWPGIEADRWQTLAQIAFRTGAVGPGTPLPDLAAHVRSSLEGMANDILADNADEDGVPFINDETTIVMSTLAALGWDWEVEGEGIPYNARATYQEEFGDAPAEP